MANRDTIAIGTVARSWRLAIAHAVLVATLGGLLTLKAFAAFKGSISPVAMLGIAAELLLTIVAFFFERALYIGVIVFVIVAATFVIFGSRDCGCLGPVAASLRLRVIVLSAMGLLASFGLSELARLRRLG